MNEDRRWHRGSRFWSVGREALRIGAGIVLLVIWRAPEAVPEALGMWGGLGAVILGGGTWTNLKERDTAQEKAKQAGEVRKAQVEAGATPEEMQE